MTPQFQDFEQFWRHYVRQHAQPATRRWHFIGTTAALAAGITAIVSRSWWVLGLAPVVGYGLSWLSHAIVEQNRPASFTHPWWSLRADARMWALIATGQMQRAVDEAMNEPLLAAKELDIGIGGVTPLDGATSDLPVRPAD